MSRGRRRIPSLFGTIYRVFSLLYLSGTAVFVTIGAYWSVAEERWFG